MHKYKETLPDAEWVVTIKEIWLSGFNDREISYVIIITMYNYIMKGFYV